MLAIEPSAGGDEVKQARRRGRPTQSDQSEAEIVEWWKPGWRDRFRQKPPRCKGARASTKLLGSIKMLNA
jgi:hypothetical protein